MLRLALVFSIALTAHAQTPFTSLEELRASLTKVAESGQADDFWKRVLAHKTMPLIFHGDVVFLYRGSADSVEWRGDFSSWEPAPETRGRRLGKTDVWVYERSFPLDARLDYKLVTDGATWLLDPLNPYQQMGGYGPNSEVRMPRWRAPEHVKRQKGVARGTLGADIAFASRKLGYTVNYRVYTPAGFDHATAKKLPVLYVTDGSDYWNDEMGSLVITLDNLIAGKRIVPLIAVFIDPWDRVAGVNRRETELVPAADRTCAFCEFIAEELVPAIDAAYPTRASRDARAILGTSLGGLHATYMSTHYASLFGLAGIQSPALWPAPWVVEEIGRGTRLPRKAFISAGTFEKGFAESGRDLRDRFKRAGVNAKYIESHEGHSWGQWRALLDDLLLFFFSNVP